MENKAAAKTILIVEDEVDLALSFKEMLEQHGFSVHTAANGVSALKYLQGRDVDVVLCDLKLPQLGAVKAAVDKKDAKALQKALAELLDSKLLPLSPVNTRRVRSPWTVTASRGQRACMLNGEPVRR